MEINFSINTFQHFYNVLLIIKRLEDCYLTNFFFTKDPDSKILVSSPSSYLSGVNFAVYSILPEQNRSVPRIRGVIIFFSLKFHSYSLLANHVSLYMRSIKKLNTGHKFKFLIVLSLQPDAVDDWSLEVRNVKGLDLEHKVAKIYKD